MSEKNRDIQATHQIINIFERSKAVCERVLDDLPGILAILDSEGRIYRSNVAVASLFGKREEDIFGEKLQTLFDEQQWEFFKSAIERFSRKPLEFSGALEFEASARSLSTGREIPCLWSLTRFELPPGVEPEALVSVVGHDISELRKAENNLSAMFSTIPLGIITVLSGGEIDGRYSAYTEVLLGRPDIAGKSILEVIFSDRWQGIEAGQREAVTTLASSVGGSIEGFHAVRAKLPQQISLKGSAFEGGIRHLGISYHPVAQNGRFERCMVMLEDRTRIVEEEKIREKERLTEERKVARRQQVQNCAQDLLPLMIEETTPYLKRLPGALQSQDAKELAFVLHAIKGIARVGGFDFLKDMVHATETRLKDFPPQGPEQWEVFARDVAEVEAEWAAIVQDSSAGAEGGALAQGAAPQQAVEDSPTRRLFEKLNAALKEGSTKEGSLAAERIGLALRSCSFVQLDELKKMLAAQAEKTAEKLQKKVQVEYAWDALQLDPEIRNVINECLLHLLNNALAHGIETPVERAGKGKPEAGRVRIMIKKEGRQLHCTVDDDGQGVQVDKVLDAAVKAKVLDLNTALAMGREEAMQLVLGKGVSSAESVDDVAGRGFGMGAVVQALRSRGGKIVVEDSALGGARFEFWIPQTELIEPVKSLMPMPEFAKRLIAGIQETSKQENFSLKLGADQEAFRAAVSSGLFYGDRNKTILAVTTVVGAYCAGGAAVLQLAKYSEDKVLLKLERTDGGSSDGSASIEFLLPLKACESYITRNGGMIGRTENVLSVLIGHRLTGRQLPTIHVGMDRGLGTADARETIKRMSKIAEELEIPCKFLGDLKTTQEPDVLIGKADGTPAFKPKITLGGSEDVIRRDWLAAVERVVGQRKAQ